MNSVFASIPSPTIHDLNIGMFQIRFYALFIILGIILAILVSALRLKAKGGTTGTAVDVAIWAVPFGIIGGRLYHVATHLNDYFGAGKDPKTIFYVWEGGLAIYGALLFGALGVYLGARFSGIRFFAYADALVPGLLLAQGIGRWGNYFNSELFGTPTTLPWGLQIDSINPAWPVGLPADTLMQPTFLYESLWDLIGVAVLLVLEKKFRLQWGKLTALYITYYSIGRALIEPIRLDPANIFLGIRTNEWTAIIGIVLGLVLFFYLSKRHPGVETSVYLPGKEPVAEAVDENASVSVSSDDHEYSTDEVDSKTE